jgi:hypothetical protein
VGAPPQYPRINLPGAEYFALAPNRSVALGGRRGAYIQTPNLTVPGTGATTGANNVQKIIETPFPANSAIYIHDLWVLWAPADNSGKLQVAGLQVGFGVNNANPNDIVYRVASPSSTTTAPAGNTLIATERDKLIHKQELVQLEGGDANQLVFGVQITATNIDTVGPHTVAVGAFVLYTRLDGLVI